MNGLRPAVCLTIPVPKCSLSALQRIGPDHQSDPVYGAAEISRRLVGSGATSKKNGCISEGFFLKGSQLLQLAHKKSSYDFSNFRSFSIRPPDVKRVSAGHNYARPVVKSAIPLFGRGHSFAPALHKARAAARRRCQGWRSHRRGRLVLDGSEHGSMLDDAGTAEVFRCRSQGLASLRDGHGGPPSMG